MLETFWQLQTTSPQEAQEFLGFLRSAEPVDVESLKNWFHERRSGHRQDENIGSRDVDMNQSSMLDETRAKAPKAIGFDHLQDRSSPATLITISSVKAAVEMFLQSAGMLFHVFTRKQVDAIYQDTLTKAHYHENFCFLNVLTEETSARRNTQLAELCGMAALGTLYVRVSSQDTKPPPEAADFLYSMTKSLLDSAIQLNPMRAMKVCALLAMYNIVLKATVALAYVGKSLLKSVL